MKFKITLISILIAICVIFCLISRRLDKTLKDFAETTGANHVGEIINQCVLGSVENQSAEYNSICKIHYDSAGKITAISINPQSVNKLKGETVSSIIRTLKEDSEESFSVPLGTLLGSRLFSSRGAEIKINTIPLGTVSAELAQKFTSVGINQTLHSLYLDIRIVVKIASPFSSTSISVNTNVCIAETVIIGEIPFTFID